MKLDPRVKAMPFNCINCEEAKKYIGTKGLFLDNLSELANINPVHIWELREVDDNSGSPFVEGTPVIKGKDIYLCWNFFLPIEFIDL